MRNILSLLFLLSFISCSNHSNKDYAILEGKFSALKTENERLNKDIQELKTQIIGYQTSPDKLLANAKRLYAKSDLDGLLETKNQLVKYHPESKESKEVANLYAQAKAISDKKIEDQKKKALAAKEAEKRKRMQAVSRLRKSYDDVAGTTWYENPYFKHYDNANATSIYIGKSKDSVWLRLKMSYSGDDWIFFKNAYLSYDGNTHEIDFDQYRDKKSDNDSSVWEWIDVSVDSSLLAFLREMVNGTRIKMRLSGKYEKTRNLSTNEINAIKAVLLAYDVLEKGE